MYELNRELVNKLSSVVHRLENIARENPIYIDLFNKLSDLSIEINKLKPPLIYTRELFEKYTELFIKIENTSRVLDKFKQYVSEEITTQLVDLMSSLHRYLDVLKKTYRKERLLFILPIASVLLIYSWSVFIYFSTNIDLAKLFIIPLIIAFGSLIVNNKGFLTLSYILLTSSAVVSTGLVIIYGKGTTYEQYSILLYLLILLTSVSYIHTSRLIGSKTNRERIINFMDNLIKLTSSTRERLEDNVLKTRELEEKAIEIYRKLYGSDGDKLFSYKLNILIMHGYRREEALKRTLSQVGETS